jgi:hypothetical protein
MGKDVLVVVDPGAIGGDKSHRIAIVVRDPLVAAGNEDQIFDLATT